MDNVRVGLKERYFTVENIEEQSKEMLNEILNFRQKHDMEFIPEKSALIILDMQKHFLDENSHAFVPSAPAIVPNIRRLMKFYLDNKYPVFATTHIDTENNDSMMLKWWKGVIKKGDEKSEIIPDFNKSDIIIMEKSQYDAFYKTNLEQLLLSRGINQVIITGVMTHLCCESTARSAFVHGFEVFFPVDATATYNKQFHFSTLYNLSHGFAIPVLSRELIHKGRSER
jgi:isochorismate hydrolase